MSDTREQLSSTSVALHWIIGIAMICMVFFGMYFADIHCEQTDAACAASKGSLRDLHKSFGLIILVLATWRFLRRVSIGALQPVGVYAAWETILAKLVVLLLLLATLLAPLSGIGMTLAAGRPLALFGLQIVPPNLFEPNKALGGFFHEAHETIGWLILAAVVLHVAGALKHHIVDGDGTLVRIMGSRVTPTRDV